MLTLLVLPALYRMFHRHGDMKLEEFESEAGFETPPTHRAADHPGTGGAMAMGALKIVLVTGVAMAVSACSAETERKAADAESPFHFMAALAGHEHTHLVPVRVSSGRKVKIVSAHAVQDGPQMRVYGQLRRVILRDPVPEAHIDVRLVSASGKILAHAPATYSQTGLEQRNRGGVVPTTGFSAPLPLPPPGSHVEVIHHDESIRYCSGAGCKAPPRS
jgi:hypothetical protein